jgi:carbamoyl-phosphate synthase large subunit
MMGTVKQITVGVTGLNNIDSPGPGIPVIRGLKESTEFDIRIIGLAYEHLEPGIYMRDLVDKSYMIPYPADGKDELFRRLHEIHDKEKLDAIIPNFDAELFSFIKLERDLRNIGIKTFLPSMKQFEERNKSNLSIFGEKYGITVPSGKMIFNVTELENYVRTMNLPVMIKGKYYDAYQAFTIEQAAYFFSKISAVWGLPVIVQEYIRGTEVNIAALGDGKGNMLAAVPMRKQYITDKGKAWGGITIDDPMMLDLVRKIISVTKWKGALELELIRTADNKLCLLEINPRIPAWIYLAVGAGQNIPEALLKLALGLNVKPFDEYKIGKMFIRYSYDMLIDLEQYSQLAITGEM